MRYTILISIFILFITSCNKNKYTSAPQLKYESVNTKKLSRGETLRITLSFTDAEGDLQDSIFVQKIVSKCRDNSNSSFTQLYKVPEFPAGKNQAGDIVISYGYTSINPICQSRNDTAVFRFVLKDKQKNKSDTVTSEPIVIVF
jgi:hypothetical protein